MNGSAPPRTVAELQEQLSRREVTWERDLPQIDPLSGTIVVREVEDGGVETYVLERGAPCHRRRFATEAEAMGAAWHQVFAVDQEPTAVRRPTVQDPRTVEELKTAMAEVGQDPDEVTRREVLDRSPKTEPVLVVERRADGRVTTSFLERGVEDRQETYPDEATAVAYWAEHLVAPHVGDEVSDLRVERMRVHLEQYLQLWAQHEGR